MASLPLTFVHRTPPAHTKASATPAISCTARVPSPPFLVYAHLFEAHTTAPVGGWPSCNTATHTHARMHTRTCTCTRVHTHTYTHTHAPCMRAGRCAKADRQGTAHSATSGDGATRSCTHLHTHGVGDRLQVHKLQPGRQWWRWRWWRWRGCCRG